MSPTLITPMTAVRRPRSAYLLHRQENISARGRCSFSSCAHTCENPAPACLHPAHACSVLKTLSSTSSSCRRRPPHHTSTVLTPATSPNHQVSSRNSFHDPINMTLSIVRGRQTQETPARHSSLPVLSRFQPPRYPQTFEGRRPFRFGLGSTQAVYVRFRFDTTNHTRTNINLSMFTTLRYY